MFSSNFQSINSSTSSFTEKAQTSLDSPAQSDRLTCLKNFILSKEEAKENRKINNLMYFQGDHCLPKYAHEQIFSFFNKTELKTNRLVSRAWEKAIEAIKDIEKIKKDMPSLKSFFIPSEKLEFSFLPNKKHPKIIGIGGMSIVFEAVLNGKEVAIKFAKREVSPFEGDILHEANIMRQLESKCITEFNGVTLCHLKNCWADILKGENYGIVMKRYKQTLYHALRLKDFIPYKTKIMWAKQISDALAELHQKGFYHRDIKSLNIFLDEESNARLGDFGLTRPATLSSADEKYKNYNEERVGCDRYRAFNLFYFNKDAPRDSYSAACDIYSMGLIFWEIMAEKTPFDEVPASRLGYTRVKKKPHETVPENWPPFFKNLIQACWNDDLSKRPTAMEISKELEQELSTLTINKLSSRQNKF